MYREERGVSERRRRRLVTRSLDSAGTSRRIGRDAQEIPIYTPCKCDYLNFQLALVPVVVVARARVCVYVYVTAIDSVRTFATRSQSKFNEPRDRHCTRQTDR